MIVYCKHAEGDDTDLACMKQASCCPDSYEGAPTAVLQSVLDGRPDDQIVAALEEREKGIHPRQLSPELEHFCDHDHEYCQQYRGTSRCFVFRPGRTELSRYPAIKLRSRTHPG
jgi:hypothetical protein